MYSSPSDGQRRVLCIYMALAMFLALLHPAVSHGQQNNQTPKANDVLMPRYWVDSRSYNDDKAAYAQGISDVYFHFSPHEGACKDRYGRDWHNVCAQPTGLAGKPAEGASLSPDKAGDWRWQSDASLTFQPAAAWAPGQEYKVVNPEQTLPPGTTLMHDLIIKTRPIQIHAEGNFKFDPENLDSMGISGSLSFNYPIDADSVMSRLSFQTSDAKVLLGENSFHWSNTDSRSILYFSVPVLDIPDQGSEITVKIAPGVMARSGGAPDKGLDFVIGLPGKNNLFQLEAATAVVVTTGDMRAKQLLALEFSLPTTPRQVQSGVKALLLPRQRINTEENAGSSPYSWWNLDEINSEILQQSETVGLTLDEGADLNSRMISLAFDRELEPGRTLLVTIPQGVQGLDGLGLNQASTLLVQVPSFTEVLQIMQNGGVLALTGDKTVSLYSRNLDAVSFELMQLRPEFINHFVSTNYGSFAQPRHYDLGMPRLSIINRGSLPLTRKDSMSAQFASLDLSPYLTDSQQGLFYLKLSGERDHSPVAHDDRFILVTDLGLIHKKMSDGSGEIYVASLSSGDPLRNILVQILGANGLPVHQANTDSDGRIAVPDLSGLPPEKNPVAIIAKQGLDLAFLPYTSGEREIDYSSFDIGGNRSVDGLDAFMFAERDLFRPGETLHFGYIVRQGEWEEPGLADLPLKAVVYDSRGNIFATSYIKLPQGGLGDLEYETPETAPTGAYHIDLMLNSDGQGDILASRSFRVEEFQPDSLRLTVSLFPKTDQGWLRPQDLAALSEVNSGPEPAAAALTAEQDKIENTAKNDAGDADREAGPPPAFEPRLKASANLVNLFGAPAVGHRIAMQAEASPAYFSFRKYSGWFFHDPLSYNQSSREELEEAETDDKGDAEWIIPDRMYAERSSRLTVTAEGFEAGGGRSVKASASMLISPLDYLVGWRSGSSLSYLRQDSPAEVELVAIGPDLEPVALDRLSLETFAVTYVKSLIRDDRGQYRYDYVRQDKSLGVKAADLPAGGLSVSLDLSSPGDKLLVIRDSANIVVASLEYTVAGDAAAAFGEDRTPVFTARLDKADYNPGDDVEIFMSTPYKGSGLITVERDTVVARAWFNSEAGEQIRKIRLPDDFEGKAYLNITYFRALDERDIFTKPLAPMIVPFTVNMDNRDLGLKLDIPDDQSASDRSEFPVIRPGGTFGVEVSARRPGRAIVFAVDEGILQMTSYRTPDPLTELLGNRALQVSTYQYFDLLMPEYNLMQSVLSAFGGGEGLNFAALGQNPFRRPGEKSAVFWSGLIDVGPNPTKVDIPVPPYFNGQLRIMAVASSASGTSSARTDVQVQAEVVIQPAVPLFVAPGDVFEGAVTLTDMSGLAPAPGSAAGRNLILEIETGAGLAYNGEAPLPVELFDARAKTLRLPFTATENLGGSVVTFRIRPLDGQPGGEVTRPASLSVRPATARTTRMQLGRLEQGPAGDYTMDLPVTREVYPQFNSFQASLSALPLPAAHGFMQYLDQYPYGCTEQLLSAAFPALAAYRHPELAPYGKAYTPDALRDRITKTMNMLSQRSYDGELLAWPNGYRGDVFLAAYAADFLITAEETGVAVPYNLKRDIFDTLSYRASQTPTTIHDARTNAYAAWVLTRNGEITTNILATLTAWLNRYHKGWESDIAGVFMAGCWQLLRQTGEAERLISAYDPGPFTAWGDDWTFSAMLCRAFYLSVLAGQFPERLQSEEAQTILDEMLELAKHDRYVTLFTAQAARAFMAYSQNLNQTLEQAGILARDRNGQIMPLEIADAGQPYIAGESAEDADSVLTRLGSISFQSEAPAFWLFESTGFDRDVPVREVFNGMEVKRELRLPDSGPVTEIRQGQELVIVLKGRAYDDYLEDVAIVDLLPGGFEMILAEGGAGLESGTGQGYLRQDKAMDVAYVERREDRLLLFPSLGTEETVYRYRVKAVTPGTYTLPPLMGEAMYNPNINAVSKARTITIK